MKLILAADEKWSIGKDGGLLCYIPGDLKYFKERTAGKTVVMGRPTLESLPGGKPLPKRDNIVLSTRTDYQVEGAQVIHSTEALMKILAEYDSEEVFIIGGGKVYNEFLPLCDTCYLTKIYQDFDADTHFVNLDETAEFQVVWQSDVQEENGIRYQFFEYRRK